jgi:hypothetical protein
VVSSFFDSHHFSLFEKLAAAGVGSAGGYFKPKLLGRIGKISFIWLDLWLV